VSLKFLSPNTMPLALFTVLETKIRFGWSLIVLKKVWKSAAPAADWKCVQIAGTLSISFAMNCNSTIL
jgi:hypothetical protein